MSPTITGSLAARPHIHHTTQQQEATPMNPDFNTDDIYTAVRLITDQIIDINDDEHRSLVRLAQALAGTFPDVTHLTDELDELLTAHNDMVRNTRHPEYDRDPDLATCAQSIAIDRVRWAQHARSELRSKIKAGNRHTAEAVVHA